MADNRWQIASYYLPICPFDRNKENTMSVQESVQENAPAVVSEKGIGACSVWFLGGMALSITTLCALVLMVLLTASTALNVYLGWKLSGLEIVVIRPTPVLPSQMVITPTTAMVMAPVETPLPTSTPTPLSTSEVVAAQVETVAAIATTVAVSDSTPPASAAITPVTPMPPAAPPPSASVAPTAPESSQSSAGAEFSPPPAASPSPEVSSPPAVSPNEVVEAAMGPASASNNLYNLIPIEGERENRPPAEHGDLNLKLRDPQPIEVELGLVDAGEGVDSDAPKLSAIFKPEFKAAYTVHDWDWGSNSKGKLIEDKEVVLVGLKTTPGEPVYIPPRQQDIYDGKYRATLLYADENSLTFVYSRAGNVTKGYTVHYLGLQTDPNLLALFRESQGNELPGLTLDTPVGLAADELIVAIRDNGKFLDTRSKNDWWD
jgi:hypothetical protein